MTQVGGTGSNLSPKQLPDGAETTLRILYLAPHAPEAPNTPPPPEMDSRFGLQPHYHYSIYRVLLDLGLTVTPGRDAADLMRDPGAFNYVFTLHNRGRHRNSEVLISALCEHAGLPYLGAPPNMRALAEDKWLTKRTAAAMGLSVIEGCAYRDHSELDREPGFPGPFMVKPRFGAASEHIGADAACIRWESARDRAAHLFDLGEEVLVERLIDGHDITVPVLGGLTPCILPAVEIHSALPHGVVSHGQKRALEEGRSRKLIPVGELPVGLRRAVDSLIEEVMPFDYLRIDFRIDARSGMHHLLELNQCSSLSPSNALGASAASVGLGTQDLVQHILALSLERQWDRYQRLTKNQAPDARRS
ncbi:MAG: hypothetical protein HQ481_02975 [Alphaproteobacteria bacterium]|nr:hypothetical protein [Alphaproteobacteria bacterium]